MDTKDLLEFDRRAREDGKRYKTARFILPQLLQEKGRHFIGIVGPRGVGKTVVLKQLAEQFKDSLYLSADTLGDHDLFDAVAALHDSYGIRAVLIDEIHFISGYDAALKKIYDFLEVRVIFTSSVSLSIFASAYDLSRRIRLVTLYPFSFREFIYFKTGDHLEPLSLDQIAQGAIPSRYLRYEYLFDPYLQGGCMPFSLDEPDVLSLLSNVVRTIISRDIPSVERLRIDELGLIEKVVHFAGKAPVEDINYSSIARNVGITKYKSEQYVGLLQKAFLLNPVFPAGTNVLREPKMLFCLPYRLLYRSWADAVGGIREDYLTESLRMAGYACAYLKSTRGQKTPDYLVERNGECLVVEVGGRRKGREQFKGFAGKKAIVFAHGGGIQGIRRPLMSAGFLDAD
ncbi:MAG: AAA family ATPase [Chitinivibrionales bacterium]|nr:AAA family ATPase [Chitinivibrionales bacterium]